MEGNEGARRAGTQEARRSARRQDWQEARARTVPRPAPLTARRLSHAPLFALRRRQPILLVLRQLRVALLRARAVGVALRSRAEGGERDRQSLARAAARAQSRAATSAPLRVRAGEKVSVAHATCCTAPFARTWLPRVIAAGACVVRLERRSVARARECYARQQPRFCHLCLPSTTALAARSLLAAVAQRAVSPVSRP
jgi:hypothetical protein